MIWRPGAVAALAAALAVALSGTAAASPTWLTAQNLSAAGRDAETPQVGVDPAGNSVAIWARSNGANTIIQGAARPAGGIWSPTGDLSAAGRNATEPQIAVDGAGNAVAVWARSNGSHTIVQAAFRPSGGGWTAADDLSAAGRPASEPQVAVDPAGNAVAVWKRFNGFRNVVQGAVRPAGGSWGEPDDLSDAAEDAEEPQVALDGAGNAVAVWSRYDGSDFVVQSATKPAGGGWSEADDLSEAGENAIEPEVAVDGAGNAAAVWARDDGSDQIVQVSGRPAGGSWSLGDDLSDPGEDAEAPQVSVAPGGGAVAVWTRTTSGPYSVAQAATGSAGGGWGPATDLSAGGVSTAETPQVAHDGSGNAVALWARSAGSPTVIETVALPPGGGWTAPKLLSELGGTAAGPQVALNASGDGAAVWSRDNDVDSIVQAVGHDSAGPQLRSIQIPSAASVRQPVSFSVAPFDVWSRIGPVAWTFGDGEGAAGLAVSHSYTRPGSYRVALVGSDVAGNATEAAGAVTVYRKPNAAKFARLRRGRALLRVTCPSPAGCEGVIRLIARVETERGGRKVGRRRQVGRKPFAVPGAATSRVAVRLTRAGVGAVKSMGRKGLKSQLTGPGIQHRIVVLLPPRRRG